MEYLHSYWPLISSLRRALRTEHSVRLAVLYGSFARGDDDAGSDVDLLVSLAHPRPSARSQLSARLQRVVDRHVDIAVLEQVEVRAPLLLDRVLEEGRVLIDRDKQWRKLGERQSTIHARALQSHRSQMADAARAIEELTG